MKRILRTIRWLGITLMKELFIVFFLLITNLTYSQIFQKSVNLGVSVIQSNKKLENTDTLQSSDRIISVRTITEEPITSYGLFVNYSTNFNKHFFIATGLKYQRLGYETSSSYFNSPSGEPFIQHGTDAVDLFHFLSVNLKFGYAIINRKNASLYITGSYLSGIMVKSYVVTQNNSDKSAYNSTSNNRSFNPKFINQGASIALGSSIRVSENSAIIFEVAHYRNLKPINSDPIAIKMWNLSLNFGYQLNLFPD